MQKVLNKIVNLIIDGYFWALDYLYVAYWQLRDLFARWDPESYTSPSASSDFSIILIPGVYESWKFMRPVAESLHQQGYDVRVVENLKFNRGSVEDMARVVREYLHKSNIKKCLLVAHSKGGLIGKYLLLNYNKDKRIKGMVTLNTPFSGSKYAYFFLPFKTVRMFLPTAPLLKNMAINESVNARIVSIYGVFDPHIPGGSYLKGAQNIQLKTRGHFRIMGSKKVHTAIFRAIRKLK